MARGGAGGRTWVESALEVVTSPILLAGAYVWSVACAPTFFFAVGQLGAKGASRAGVSAAASLLAIACLLAAVMLERRRSRSAAAVGSWGVLGSASAAWLSAPVPTEITRLDGLRGLLGAAGFCLYALAWGVPDALHRRRPEDDPRAEAAPLGPRGKLPVGAVAVFGLGVVAAGAVASFAWDTHEPARAAFAQAMAGVVCVALVSGAGRVATGRGAGGAWQARAVGAARGLVWLLAFVVLCAGYYGLTR